MLASVLSYYCWMTLLRGVIWILFGILVFKRPAISLLTLTLFFGAFALADGVAAIVSAFARRPEEEDRWLLLLVGLCGVGVGVRTLLAPGVSALALLFYIAL